MSRSYEYRVYPKGDGWLYDIRETEWSEHPTSPSGITQVSHPMNAIIHSAFPGKSTEELTDEAARQHCEELGLPEQYEWRRP
jgi:hypothetical protein